MDDEDLSPDQLIEFLTGEMGWNDDRIWKIHLKICDDRIEHHKQQIDDLKESLKQEQEKNKRKLQVKKNWVLISCKDDLDRLLRYESSIQRQFLKH